MRWLIILLVSGVAAQAEGERAGVFDYWVLSLSWSPNWCAAGDRAEEAEQCDPSAGHGWILHGLWPQYQTGWPSYCTGAPAPPTRAQTGDMADIMGSGGLAWYQWKKHGSCAGLPPTTYFAMARQAWGAVARPPAFRALQAPARLSAQTVEDAFLNANPGLQADMLTVTCRDDRIDEVRICLSRNDLAPMRCGRDVLRDCALDDALMLPIP